MSRPIQEGLSNRFWSRYQLLMLSKSGSTTRASESQYPKSDCTGYSSVSTAVIKTPTTAESPVPPICAGTGTQPCSKSKPINTTSHCPQTRFHSQWLHLLPAMLQATHKHSRLTGADILAACQTTPFHPTTYVLVHNVTLLQAEARQSAFNLVL